NRTCRATLTTITATTAMRTSARMAGMVIGLRSFRLAGALGERERIWRLAIRTAAAGRGGWARGLGRRAPGVQAASGALRGAAGGRGRSGSALIHSRSARLRIRVIPLVSVQGSRMAGARPPACHRQELRDDFQGGAVIGA